MQIENYLIQEILHQGKKFFVYRGTKTDDSNPYVLKVLEKKAVHQLKIFQSLKKEYHFLRRIESDHVVKAVDWIEGKERTILVLEDINGTKLKDPLKKKPLPIDRFIEIALQITGGLAAVHRHEIIHQDINSNNIIRDPRTGRLRIIDFDIASTYDIRVSSPGSPESLQGTLSYMSPEQTGRLNRRVDQRSDLYSLGVTFYEMLTGNLPFYSHDPMELVYAHLARTPQPPSVFNAHIPGILSKIVLKLMAKAPEDRYQSAQGLAYDLEKLQKEGCLSGVEIAPDFVLGGKDYPGKLLVPEKLYGREQEIAKLLNVYSGVTRGSKDMVLVVGYPGTGKTALVKEIHKPVTKDRGWFISGKFDQLQRAVPYFAIIQALDRFCQLLLTENPEVLLQWKNRILQTVGDLGKILTDIIPQLELVTGKQPDVPEISGGEAEKRLNYVFQHFFQAISTKEHPLVLFIDDLQWADLASLNLLKALMEDKQIRHLLCIGAYRDNEISPSHPLMATLEVIQQEIGDIPVIPVGSLSPEHLGKWLKDTLNAETDREIADINNLVYRKTRGNAFFTRQFLENLYKEKLLQFDFNRGMWQYDIGEIEKQDITDNVVDLLVRGFRTLPAAAQEVLKLASCIGSTFDMETLSVVSQKDKNERLTNLEILFREHLVYPLGDGVYKFVHDQVHRAAYLLIPDEEKKGLHLQIGRLLLKTVNIPGISRASEDAGRHIFDIVNHLDAGMDLIETGKEKLELARLNLEAGRFARRSGAYTFGYDYVQKALRLLPADCRHRHYDLTLAVYNEAVQASYLCGHFEEMEGLVEKVIRFTPGILDRAIAYEYRMLSYNAQQQAHLAEKTLLDTFKQLGVYIPQKPGKLKTWWILLKARAIFKHSDGERLNKLPLMENPQIQLVMKLLAGGIAGIMHSSQELLPYVVGKMVGLTLEYGLAKETPFVLSLYGITRNLTGHTAAAYRVGKLCMDLLEKVPGNEIVKPKVIMNACLYMLGWKEHYKTTAARLKENYQYALNVGDFEWANFSFGNHAGYLSHTGMELSALKKLLHTTEEVLIKLKHPMDLSGLKMEILYVSNLLGHNSNRAFLDMDRHSFPKDLPEGIILVLTYQVYIRKAFLAYLFEDYTHTEEYVEELEHCWKNMTVPIIFFKSYYHFYIPLIYLQLYTRTGSKKTGKSYLARVRRSIKLMKEWAELGPVNFLHKYYLMQAELYRVTGKTNRAEEYYEKAVDTAYENDYINEAALANELAAKFYLQNNRDKLAAFYLLEAKNCYSEWGAVAKVDFLQENYPIYLRYSIPASKSADGTISSSMFETTGASLDVRSILKATRTLSGEIQFKRLLETMMQILVENAGAEKGVLIENRNGSLTIQAEVGPDGIAGILQELPVEESGKVPLLVINYVARSKRQLVFDNVSNDVDYSADDYIQTHHPKSAVCFPILRKGDLYGIIYLENNRIEGAFTLARLEMLNMLSAQIAISIENAELYEHLETKVQMRTRELEESHKALEESYRKISDSVNYAGKIQNAVLPAREIFEKLFPRHYIFYRPCSVVSGDFYWIKQVGHKIVVAAADCTGHGIPGALVSMLGMAFLNEIVPLLDARSSLTAGNILDDLRSRVKIALQQKGKLSEQKDGMDIALCIVDPIEKQLQYAGAYNPLYLLRNDHLTEVKADRMPVGVYRKERPFTLHNIPYRDGDMLYLFTDGFIHQNSEDGHETFTRKRFKELLIEINQEPVSKQQEILTRRFDEWKGDLPQRDDILILAIRL